MAMVHPITFQYRTLDRFFLLKERLGQLSIKIYDVSRKCLFKGSAPLTDTGSPATTDLSALIEKLVQRNVIPRAHLPPSQVTLDDMRDGIQHLISESRKQLSLDGSESTPIPEYMKCPITLDVFQKPVIDEHGHTFEERAIAKHLETHKICPLNRQQITSLTPNRALQDAIEALLGRDPIPTFALFRRFNPTLSESNLTQAREYTGQEEYEEALQCYTTAFQYTNDWKAYADLPTLLLKMGKVNEALLAYYHLAKYQIHAGEVQEAVRTLEACMEAHSHQDPITSFEAGLNILIVKLRMITNADIGHTVDLALRTAEATGIKVESAIELYRLIINHSPTTWEAYSGLVRLLPGAAEKAHVLLKGACFAIQQQEHQVAESFCKAAERCDPNSYNDSWVYLDLLTKQDQKAQVKVKLSALIIEYQNHPTELVKVYKALSRLDYNPDYYRGIVAAYEQLQKPQKVLKWLNIWLSILIERKDWSQAEEVAQLALGKAEQSPTDQIATLEKLEQVYLNWENSKLDRLWYQLGAAYLQNQQFDHAERTYRKGFEKFPAFRHAVGLGDSLAKQGDVPRSVQAYYEAFAAALLEADSDNLVLQTLDRIRAINPQMRHLDTVKKVQLLSQARIIEQQRQLSFHKELQALSRQEFACALKGPQSFYQEELSDTASGYMNVGTLLRNQGRYREALAFAEKALEIHRKFLGEDHPATASSYNTLGMVLLDLYDHETSSMLTPKKLEAFVNLQRALEARIRVFGEDHLETAQSYNNLSVVLRLLARGEEAEVSARKSLEIHKRILGQDHLATALSYSHLGRIIDSRNIQERRQESLDNLQEALDIRKGILGDEHPDIAESYDVLGECYFLRGQDLDYFKKALEIYRKTLGEEHPLTAKSYYKVYEALSRHSSFSSIEPSVILDNLQQALKIYRQTLGEEHPATVECYRELGGVMRTRNRLTEALECFRKVVEINKKNLGKGFANPNDEKCGSAWAYQDLGEVLYTLGNYQEALENFQEAFNNSRDGGGSILQQRARKSCEMIGQTMSHLGNHEGALEWWQKSLEYLETFNVPRYEWPRFYESTGEVLSALARDQEALGYHQKALVILESFYGEGNSEIAQCCSHIGRCFYELGQYESALASCQRALALSRQYLGEEHKDTARSYYFVGQALEGLKRNEEALEHLQKALDIQKKLFGEQHPDTGDSYMSLYSADIANSEASLYRVLTALGRHEEG